MVLSKDVKIAICFGLIMGVIFSICDLCFAAENVSLSSIYGVGFNSGYDTMTSVSSSNFTSYCELEPGYRYTITALKTSTRRCAFSNDIPAEGVEIFDYFEVEGGTDYSFNSGSFGYLFFNVYPSSDINVVVTREPLLGLTGFVDNLAYDLSYANLSGVLFFVVPILAIGVLFGLGFYFIKRILNKFKKAKGGI